MFPFRETNTCYPLGSTCFHKLHRYYEVVRLLFTHCVASVFHPSASLLCFSLIPSCPTRAPDRDYRIVTYELVNASPMAHMYQPRNPSCLLQGFGMYTASWFPPTRLVRLADPLLLRHKLLSASPLPRIRVWFVLGFN